MYEEDAPQPPARHRRDLFLVETRSPDSRPRKLRGPGAVVRKKMQKKKEHDVCYANYPDRTGDLQIFSLALSQLS